MFGQRFCSNTLSLYGFYPLLVTLCLVWVVHWQSKQLPSLLQILLFIESSQVSTAVACSLPESDLGLEELKAFVTAIGHGFSIFSSKLNQPAFLTSPIPAAKLLFNHQPCPGRTTELAELAMVKIKEASGKNTTVSHGSYIVFFFFFLNIYFSFVCLWSISRALKCLFLTMLSSLIVALEERICWPLYSSVAGASIMCFW